MKSWLCLDCASRATPCFLLALSACGAPRAGSTPPRAGAQHTEPPREPPVSGRLLTSYRGRFTGSENDHDLYQTADLALSDPQGRWTGALLARAALDLDGRDAGEDADFFGLQDTYDDSLVVQLYHAYLDVSSERFALLRCGRQPLYETPVTLVFDGVRGELGELGPRRATLGAYAGLGAHMYESSPEGDFVAGTYAALQAWSGAELRADWLHLADERMGVDHANDIVGLSLDQDIPREESLTRLGLRFTSLEGDGRDLRFDASHAALEARASVRASLYKLLETQEELAAPLDPFSATLFELFPYYQLGLSATKDWEHLGLLAGIDLRRVEDQADEGAFNREFERYFVTGTLPERLPVELSMTGELWRATDSDHETWGAALARALDNGWRVTLGSYYALYKQELLTAEERDHVRTTYLDLGWKPAQAEKLGGHWLLRYEFERNDFDDYHAVRLEYSWSF